MVAAISSTSPYAGAPPQISSQQIQQMKQNWQDLSQALQSGDITSAQQAFSSIQSAQQQMGGQLPGGAKGQLASDFNSLSSALQSGDVTAAQKAFSTLQSDMQSQRPAGGRGVGGTGTGNSAASVLEGSGSQSSSTSSSSSAKTVTNEVRQTNSNGTVTITYTYSDNSTSSVTEQNPGPTTAQGALDSSNSGQLQTLLAAQETAQ